MIEPISQIVDPITGEVLSSNDVDQLLEAYERIDAADKKLFAAKMFIRHSIGQLTTGSAKTRRVRGKTWQCAVEMADTNWDQSVLKELWNSYPVQSQEFLKIESIAIRKREVKKLMEMTGEPDLETFKKILRSAEKPATALPRIIIEKSASDPKEQTQPEPAKEEESIW